MSCFNPRLPGGRRPEHIRMPVAVDRFNPRLPGGRRPLSVTPVITPKPFQSTPSGGKATCRRQRLAVCVGVSIHAFRGEGDKVGTVTTLLYNSFNPRLPGGRRLDRVRSGVRCIHSFNPRLPGGRRPVSQHSIFFYYRVSIHAFRGEGDRRVAQHLAALRAVSIHAFRGEGDSPAITPECDIYVSIHAFRGEGDWTAWRVFRSLSCFNPRLPGGRRHPRAIRGIRHRGFNPRLPGGRRRNAEEIAQPDDVSTHAFGGEGDDTS